MKILLPGYVEEAIALLEQHGFEACVVGGCVRDSMLGKEPLDWDVATNARRQEMQQAFAGYHVIPTGIQHGTLTVVVGKDPVEITTYRVDGVYSDGRHPDSVDFTGNLVEDLARRDFTINAMAYRRDSGLVDPFDGAQALADRSLVCVGDAAARLAEDPLRIMRGLRFACVLGFRIEDATLQAMLDMRGRLDNVARERIATELRKAVVGDWFPDACRLYHPLLTQVLPELAPCVGFDQCTHHHCYDVWEHTLVAMKASPPDLVVRLALLFHDIGKPRCMTIDSQGEAHYKGHAAVGAGMAREALERLRFDNATTDLITLLVREHDTYAQAAEKYVKRRLSKLGEEAFRLLLEVQKADNAAKAPAAADDRLSVLGEVGRLLDKVMEEGQCFRLSDLAVNGSDLQALGIPSGPAMGKILKGLLEMVVDGEIDNQKDQLLLEAAKLFRAGTN